MIYGSVCSGIEAATVAWHPLGWTAAWYSEIEKFPSAVLAHHYPNTPNLGDMTRIHEKKEFTDRPIELLVGGTPCQSFSVAGLRKGLADPRGNLALVFLGIVDRTRPRWVVWENVPGVLSSNRGRDFGAFLGALGELGYGWSYRVMDAQFFGVPQRRRRVFVVGYLGDWRRAAAVLFEPEGLRGNPSSSGQTREEAAHCLRGRANSSHREDSDNFVAHTLRGEGFDASEDGTGRGVPLVPMAYAVRDDVTPKVQADIAFTLTTPSPSGGGHPQMVFDMRGRGDGKIAPTLCTDHASRPSDMCPVITEPIAFTQNQAGDVLSGDVAPAMGTNSNATGRNTAKVQMGATVRRLTPVECERLQGFPGNYTNAPYRGKPCADGPRYKALGNSMAVPVMRWIGERIAAVDTMSPQ